MVDNATVIIKGYKRFVGFRDVFCKRDYEWITHFLSILSILSIGDLTQNKLVMILNYGKDEKENYKSIVKFRIVQSCLTYTALWLIEFWVINTHFLRFYFGKR